MHDFACSTLRMFGRISALLLLGFLLFPSRSGCQTIPVDIWRDDGLPPNVPMFISELNIAWNTGESFVDIFGGLWLADYVGAFLNAGGSGLYYFHYLPVRLYHGCNGSMGTFAMFTVDSKYQIQQPTSQYFASQLINQEWVQPGNANINYSRPAPISPTRRVTLW